jgi:hypothetical protein
MACTIARKSGTSEAIVSSNARQQRVSPCHCARCACCARWAPLRSRWAAGNLASGPRRPRRSEHRRRCQPSRGRAAGTPRARKGDCLTRPAASPQTGLCMHAPALQSSTQSHQALCILAGNADRHIARTPSTFRLCCLLDTIELESTNICHSARSSTESWLTTVCLYRSCTCRIQGVAGCSAGRR